jgi:proteic killer suppression protein
LITNGNSFYIAKLCDPIFLLTLINKKFTTEAMIQSFRCSETERIFRRDFSRKFPGDIQERAFMKLNAIDAAIEIQDLRFPPSNRLEALKGNRKGQWSIRINDQWRICFKWLDGHAEDVAIDDYH